MTAQVKVEIDLQEHYGDLRPSQQWYGRATTVAPRKLVVTYSLTFGLHVELQGRPVRKDGEFHSSFGTKSLSWAEKTRGPYVGIDEAPHWVQDLVGPIARLIQPFADDLNEAGVR